MIVAVPSEFVGASLKALPPIPADVPLVSATKGLDPERHLRMSELIAERFPDARVAVLSGPTFAREVALGRPTAAVIASRDDTLAALLQRRLGTREFRLYANRDVTGVELGGALKNVMAIATGIADGLGLGENARAALITRGLAEMTRLAVALGAVSGTLAGLAGMGDLVLTCTGSLSRNRQLGMALAKGESAASVERETRMIAEGARTVTSALALARRYAVSLPICHEVGAVLFEGKAPAGSAGLPPGAARQAGGSLADAGAAKGPGRRTLGHHRDGSRPAAVRLRRRARPTARLRLRVLRRARRRRPRPRFWPGRRPNAAPNGPGWTYRVVPNKFPALRIEGDLDPAGEGLFDKMTGVGAHEVVIETPDHGASLATLPADAVADVLLAFRERVLDLKKDPRFAYVLGVQEPRRGGRRVARASAFPADRDAHHSDHGVGRARRFGPVLRAQGALRLVRPAAAGAPRRPAPHPGIAGLRGGGAVRAAVSVRDVDPARAASGGLRGLQRGGAARPGRPRSATSSIV